MRNLNKLFAVFSVLFLIAGCSFVTGGDTNKKNLDEELFEEGREVVKIAGDYYNAEDGDDTEMVEKANAFLNKYYDDDYETEDEEYFVLLIKSLQTHVPLYGMQKYVEEMSGEDAGESDQTKEQIKETLLACKETFGIELE